MSKRYVPNVSFVLRWIFLWLCFASPLFALPTPEWQAIQTREITIIPLSESAVTLRWMRFSGEYGWKVYGSPNPYLPLSEWSLLTRTDRLEITLTGLPGRGYFRIENDPNAPRTNEILWIGFTGNPTFLSYGNEDQEPNGYAITNDGDDNTNALRLTGNTWKMMAIDPPRPIHRDFAVGASIFRERRSEWQAIGFLDSSGRSVWFGFGAKETRWSDTVHSTWQEVPPYNFWSRWRMDVGEQFIRAYRRNGLLTHLLFANDNDTTNPRGIWKVSRITDASGDQYNIPRLTVRYQRLSENTILLEALNNGQRITRGTVYWDGDYGVASTGAQTQLTFPTGGQKRILCRWKDTDRSERWTWIPITINLPEPVRTAFTYCGVGDIMIARRYETEGYIAQYGADGLWNGVRNYLTSFNLVTGNTECAYALSGTPHPNKTYLFKGQPSYVGAIVRGGIQVASLANNHTGDYGDDALRETFYHFESNGLLYCGAGMNDEEAWRPTIVYRGGQRIGILGYCTLTGREQNQPPYLEAGPNKGGFRWATRENIQRDFAIVRPMVDILIIQFHVGYIEYTTEPDFLTQPSTIVDTTGWDSEEVIADTNAVSLSDYMIENGADLVICHGPHVPQAVVRRAENKFIAYSLGNFLFDQYLPETFPTITFEADFNRFSQVREARIRPFFIDNYMPGPARGLLAKRILNHIASLSYERGTMLVEPPDTGLVRIVSRVGEYQRIGFPAETLSIPLRTVGNYRISAPYALDAGVMIEQVTILPPTGATSVQYRLGIDQLWGVGNMENEGAPTTFEFEAGESFDDSLAFTGSRSIRIRRSSGTATMTVPTFRRHAINRNQNYTLVGSIFPGAISGSNIQLNCYNSRIGGTNTGNVTVFTVNAGNQWVTDFADITWPNNTVCTLIRLRLASGGATTSYFDDVALVLWGTNWATATQFTLPNPHRWTHIQLRTSQIESSGDVRLVVQRAKYVALTR
ncbi:MAG: CapA family protein [bacterium]|nr:CapA family protein [bacterium]